MPIKKLDHLGKTIIFGNGSTKEFFRECIRIKPYKIALVTDAEVERIYSDVIDEMKDKLNIDFIHIINLGEENKTLNTAITIWERLIKEGFTRKSMLIGFGGGVVNDITGFVASTYMRGIYYATIPTTLLSQADAAIGGKNGIDFYGKNMIGTFYIPTLTVIDPRYIKSLPLKEVTNGMAEIVKHGLIASPHLINFLKANLKKILEKDMETLEYIILESIRIKLDIVSRDFREAGYRRVLNLGHTIGHAIESLSNYKISHGEAVSQGMVVSMKLGEKLLGFSESNVILELLRGLSLPVSIRSNLDRLLNEIKRDKKAWHGGYVFILPRSIGEVEVKKLPEKVVREALGELLEDMSINNG